MSQPSPNSTTPENAPDKGEAPQAEPKDVPELEPYSEEDLEAAFARLEEPKRN